MRRKIYCADTKGQGHSVNFKETRLEGAYLIELDRIEDQRGFFARSFCHNEFEKHALNTTWVQCNISFNKTRGTLRGLHYQMAPVAETKLVRCTRGAVYDVILDLRKGSKTFGEWFDVELNEDNRMAVYVPEGMAHGFQTLYDNTELFYQMSDFYDVEKTGGIRWDDPTFGFNWPIKEKIISSRDLNFPWYSR